MYLKSEIFPEYEFTVKGDIRRIDGRKLDLEISDDKIYIAPKGGNSRWLGLRWLGLLTHYKTPYHEEIVRNLNNIYFQELNITRLAKNRIVLDNHVMLFKRNIYIGEFRVVPCFPYLCINRKGDIKDVVSGYEYRVMNYEYREINVKNITVGQHRLLALAWLKNDDFNERIVVNHKDGNKYNNNLKNLEWCSYKENNLHASINGLTSVNVEIVVRDFHNGNILKFSSFSQMSNILGLQFPNSSREFIRRRPQNLWFDRYEIRVTNDTRDWFYTNRTKIVPNCRYLITIVDGNETTEYYSTKEIVEKYKLWNISHGIKTVRDEFIARYPYKHFAYIDLDKEMNDILSIQSKNTANVARPILAINVLTGEEIQFTSLKKTAKFFKMDRSKIKHGIENQCPKDNWLFKYLIT